MDDIKRVRSRHFYEVCLIETNYQFEFTSFSDTYYVVLIFIMFTLQALIYVQIFSLIILFIFAENSR